MTSEEIYQQPVPELNDVGRRLVCRDEWIVSVAAVAMLAGQLLAFLLFGLASTDTETIAEAGLILCMTMLTAAYLPVQRACRLDSGTALRRINSRRSAAKSRW
jgi:hypothetical protein